MIRLLLFFILVAGPAVADLCRDAARRAAAVAGVPDRVMLALTLTETGRGDDPWPWAANLGGRPHWFATEDELLDFARRAIGTGQTSVDLGCFQINYYWHAAAFPTLEAMVDPDRNAAYAARLLAAHYRDTGDWSAAAGRYHSRTEHHAARYRARFEALLAALPATPDLRPQPPRGAVLGSLFPLSGGS